MPAGTVEAVPAETVSEEKDVSLGRLEGGVYTNPYAGLEDNTDSMLSLFYKVN